MTDSPTPSPAERANVSAPSGRPSPIGRALPAGFALMSLVPILLALLLLGEGRSEGEMTSLGGRGGLVFLLMLGSAVSGFFFIRNELTRTIRAVSHGNVAEIVGQLSRTMRETSNAEMARISDAIADAARSSDEGSGDIAGDHERFRVGLARIAATIRTARSIQHLHHGLVDAVLEVVGARTSYLMIVDAEVGDFVTVAAGGEQKDQVQGLRIPLGDGLPGRAARERAPLRLVATQGKAAPGVTLASEGTLVVPMIRGEDITAVLLVEGKTSGQPFDDRDLEVVSDLANLAAASAGLHAIVGKREAAHEDTLRAFARLTELRDPYSRGHSTRVARYCELMARAMQMDEDTVRTLRQAALLHDIGKLSVPEELLRKDGRYTPEERVQVRKHVVAAEASLSDMPGLAALAPLVQTHHELADGNGYPRGLTGDAISLTAHILIVANAFDVMTSDRAYREAVPLATALEVLRAKSGKWYDTRAVDALLNLPESDLKAVGEGGKDGVEVHQGAAAVSIKH